MISGFRRDLLVLVLIPNLVLTAFFGYSLYVDLVQRSAINNVVQMLDMSIKATAIVHEAQIERGRTVGMITANYAPANIEAVLEQRQLTDHRIRNYFEQKDGTVISDMPERFQNQVQRVEELLVALTDHRASVDARKISVKENLDTYNTMINGLIRLLSVTREVSPSEDLNAVITPLISLVEAKDFAGLERAGGTALLNEMSRDIFNMSRYELYRYQLVGEELSLRKFVEAAPDDVLQVYYNTVSGPDVDLVKTWREAIAQIPRTLKPQAFTGTEWFAAATVRIDKIKEVEDFLDNRLSELEAQELSELDAQIAFSGVMEVLVVLISAVAGYLVARRLINPLAALNQNVIDLASGQVQQIQEGTERLDEFGAIATNLNMIANNNTVNARLKAALSGANSNVIVVDASLDIVYVNESMMKTFRNHQTAIQTDVQSFDARQIIGQNIDVFYKHSDQQRALLQNLSQPLVTELSLGGLLFKITASAVLDDDGTRIGTVFEWDNITDVVAIQQEIDHVVKAVVAGDLSSSLTLDGKDGFFLDLSKAVNQLKDTVEAVINDVGATMSAMARGDLTRRMTATYEGSYDTLKQDVNETMDRLSKVLGQVKQSANDVRGASSEISAGSLDLSQRTEQQAANLEETAASMEQMSMTVKRNAENAQQAKNVAVSARSVAEKGGKIVDDTVEAMGTIAKSSQKISDILSVIDEIAFQTNLLALNAAVEAARAGDAGKGFAVVASEVRTLAGRSSEAARDIKNLINDSSAHVNEGVNLVNEAGMALTDILDNVKLVTDIVTEIAAASREQSNGIQDINGAITQMDSMTQQNAALVEENSASARALEIQAVEMAESVGFFESAKGENKSPKASSKENRQPTAQPKRAPSTSAPISAEDAVKSFQMGGTGQAEDGWEEF